MTEPNYIFVKANDIIIKEFPNNDIRGVIKDYTLAVESNDVYLREANAANHVEMWIPIEKFNKLIEIYNKIIEYKKPII